jgi:hypothetical protein
MSCPLRLQLDGLWAVHVSEKTEGSSLYEDQGRTRNMFRAGLEPTISVFTLQTMGYSTTPWAALPGSSILCVTRGGWPYRPKGVVMCASIQRVTRENKVMSTISFSFSLLG